MILRKVIKYNPLAKRLRWELTNFHHKEIIKKLQKKDIINVVFYAMNVPMWNYQHLYELMKKNPRFKLYVVLSPNHRSPIDVRNEEAKAMRLYFEERGVPYIDCDQNGEVCVDVKSDIQPDILFYTQPYPTVMKPADYCTNFTNSLVCYYPYAFWSANGGWSYNKVLHQKAWKLFYSTDLHLKDAKRLCDNRGKNVVVTGYPKTDDFLNKNIHDVWKIKDQQHKRLIWAPHFTIQASLPGTVARSNFLIMAEMMVEMAKINQNCLQIAFKPHPRLKTELYNLEDWGKERTDKYYELWDSMPNTFLAEGEYIDLFMTSDGMVHDSSSFSIEYHYSQKPVMYVTKHLDEYKKMLNDFGKMAIDIHYIGHTKEDILSFVNNQVLKGIDPLKNDRLIFYKKYLLPPNDQSVAQNTYNNIVKSLGI